MIKVFDERLEAFSDDRIFDPINMVGSYRPNSKPRATVIVSSASANLVATRSLQSNDVLLFILCDQKR